MEKQPTVKGILSYKQIYYFLLACEKDEEKNAFNRHGQQSFISISFEFQKFVI